MAAVRVLITRNRWQIFFDIFYIGEGETVYDNLFDLYKEMKAAGTYTRTAFLREAAKIPGLYVPALFMK